MSLRDVLAGLIAIALLVVAASLAGALQQYRRQRQRRRDGERALGRAIMAEIPSENGELVLFSEDEIHFYYGEHTVDKDSIVAVRLLINGAPIAARTSHRADPRAGPATKSAGGGMKSFPEEKSILEEKSTLEAVDRPAGADLHVSDDDREGIVRDRWDVAIDTLKGTTLVACGAIRERVSQELARSVFDAVTREIGRRDAA